MLKLSLVLKTAAETIKLSALNTVGPTLSSGLNTNSGVPQFVVYVNVYLFLF